MERVNATLPHDEPDYILLTLVQGQTGQACGKLCPPGQSTSDGGRCIPNAVLAQSARRGQDVVSQPIRETGRRVAAREPERQVEAQPAPRNGVTEIARASSGAGWTTSVAPVASTSSSQSQGSISASSAAATAASIAVASAAAALPGRMAIGGPRASSTQDLIVPLAPSPAARAVHDGLAWEDNAAMDAARGGSRDKVDRGSGNSRSVAAYPPGRPVVVYRSAPAPRSAPPAQSRQTAGVSRNWMVGFFDRPR